MSGSGDWGKGVGGAAPGFHSTPRQRGANVRYLNHALSFPDALPIITYFVSLSRDSQVDFALDLGIEIKESHLAGVLDIFKQSGKSGKATKGKAGARAAARTDAQGSQSQPKPVATAPKPAAAKKAGAAAFPPLRNPPRAYKSPYYVAESDLETSENSEDESARDDDAGPSDEAHLRSPTPGMRNGRMIIQCVFSCLQSDLSRWRFGLTCIFAAAVSLGRSPPSSAVQSRASSPARPRSESPPRARRARYHEPLPAPPLPAPAASADVDMHSSDSPLTDLSDLEHEARGRRRRSASPLFRPPPSPVPDYGPAIRAMDPIRKDPTAYQTGERWDYHGGLLFPLGGTPAKRKAPTVSEGQGKKLKKGKKPNKQKTRSPKQKNKQK
ncbi:hypothetical protein JCM11641_004983 [Rhodosporidiobolus odoratus]